MLCIFDDYVKNRLTLLLSYYHLVYGLPKDVVAKKIKRRLALSYINRDAKFIGEINLRGMPKSAALYIGMLFMIVLKSKKRKPARRFKIILRDIHSDIEIDRMRPILQQFRNEEILLVVDGSLEKNHLHAVAYDSNFNNYITSISVKTLFKELVLGFPLYVYLGLSKRLNIFHFSIRIINEYLRYTSLFERYKSDYLFTERCIKISPLLRSIYKKSGGKKTMTCQKSILSADQTSFCYDVDYFLSLGRLSAVRAIKYDGYIGNTFPVGSFFSCRSLPKDYSKYLEDSYQPQYDILFIGINIMNSYSRFDTYDGFLDDYYGSISWLDKLKKEHPEYRIALKHHSSASRDQYEDEIFADSDVDIIDKSINSYSAALDSKIISTYGSTMGYELLAIGKPCIFFDPGGGNIFIDDIGVSPEVDRHRCRTYEEFENFALELIHSKRNAFEVDASNICMHPDGINERINNLFGSL